MEGEDICMRAGSAEAAATALKPPLTPPDGFCVQVRC